ncbi:hypothetical protein QVD17_17519 [Tagetes erecta]|uniref:Uncharacterized protein n=1 Tax=Tagetes erecta TaxID=13708 RepID=A0AAD8KZM6_TARER|nr:hypothetical protein QVD17_17519 [Tagetes erecta]
MMRRYIQMLNFSNENKRRCNKTRTIISDIFFATLQVRVSTCSITSSDSCKFFFGLWGFRQRPYPPSRPIDVAQVVGYKRLEKRYYDSLIE